MLGGILGLYGKTRNQKKKVVVEDGKGPSPPVLKAPVKQVRKWLSMTKDGEASSLELSKVRATQQLGIPLRDLRILDPMLATSYPSAILARERSIIVNLEFIKMIVGMDCCYITNLDDPNTTQFVEELQHRLKYGPTQTGEENATALYGHQSHDDLHTVGQPSKLGPIVKPGNTISSGGLARARSYGVMPPLNPLPELPFELRVLETALDYISKYLEDQASDLEAAAHPALDSLTQKISTASLERVRRVKNRMVRLNTRVETLKEVLEKTLDDDADMKDFNLSALEEERLESVNRQAARSASGTPFDIPIAATLGSVSAMTPQVAKSIASSASSDSFSDDEDVEVVEQLLESYFMRLDNTWNRLQTLTEYVDDTEDFINIELDSHRNQLIRLDIVLTAFTACMGLITAVTGLFAMNLKLRPNAEDAAPYSWFVIISTSAGAFAILLFISVMVYCRWKRLL
eukprot:jgi/Picsp_1/6273/NSC_03624-R2_magnesium transporter mrs2-7